MNLNAEVGTVFQSDFPLELHGNIGHMQCFTNFQRWHRQWVLQNDCKATTAHGNAWNNKAFDLEIVKTHDLWLVSRTLIIDMKLHGKFQ